MRLTRGRARVELTLHDLEVELRIAIGRIETERLATRLVLQVHDELVFEVPEGELTRMQAELPKRMASVGARELSVPLVVDVGHGENWDEAH